MTYELRPMRTGKSLLMRQMMDAALDRGERITLCGIRDEKVTYCEVIPHPTRIKR